jgi:hypothetical protein
MSLVTGEKSNFQFILRLLNTNVDGSKYFLRAAIADCLQPLLDAWLGAWDGDGCSTLMG